MNQKTWIKAGIIGVVIFAAQDFVHGREMWRSDGTTVGTYLLRDLNQTGAGSDPAFFEVIGSTAYFAATDITRGTELWKTNGAAAGTVLVKDIFTGADGEYPNSSEPRYLTGFGGTLYFSAFDPVRGRELWKSNGTAAGTTLVKDIWQGDQDSAPNQLTPSGSLLYFRASDPAIGSQLWKTGGTAASTAPITSTGNGGNPRNLTDVNGTLYFVGEASGGEALYRTSGTTISERVSGWTAT